MTSVAANPVLVAERSHLQIVEPALYRVAQLVEADWVGEVYCGQFPDLRAAVQTESDRVCLAVERLSPSLHLVAELTHPHLRPDSVKTNYNFT